MTPFIFLECYVFKDTPESTALPVAYSTSSPVPSSTSPPASSHSSSSNAGPIAGGVVGGVVGLCLIAAAFLFWWTRRRRAHKAAPSSMVNIDSGGPITAATTNHHKNASSIGTTVTSFGSSPMPKLYVSSFPSSYIIFPDRTLCQDPSDPSTYPSTPATSGILSSSEDHRPFLHPTPDIMPGGRYTGAAEL